MNQIINLIIYLVVFGLIWWLVAGGHASTSRPRWANSARALHYFADRDYFVGTGNHAWYPHTGHTLVTSLEK